MKIQRIRDPLHNLIEFQTDGELERVLWNVMATRPFQRLRRVKQLGFSDLVYPGASHSRFAHSVGVFHTARQLMGVVRKHGGARREGREQTALAAALVHDLGHGPFSHAFEKVGKRLGLKLADHEQKNGPFGGLKSAFNRLVMETFSRGYRTYCYQSADAAIYRASAV